MTKEKKQKLIKQASKLLDKIEAKINFIVEDIKSKRGVSE